MHYLSDNSSITTEIFELILEKSPINLKTAQLQNALHVAFQSDSPNEEVIRTLIKKGCSLTEKDNRDNSPLHHACTLTKDFFSV